MAYKVLYKESVTKDIKGIDRSRRAGILDAIESDLAKNPAEKGKPLKGNWKGMWRYEVWPYRIIYAIMDDKSILVVRIAHRKEVYR